MKGQTTCTTLRPFRLPVISPCTISICQQKISIPKHTQTWNTSQILSHRPLGKIKADSSLTRPSKIAQASLNQGFRGSSREYATTWWDCLLSGLGVCRCSAESAVRLRSAKTTSKHPTPIQILSCWHLPIQHPAFGVHYPSRFNCYPTT